ncbi:DUF3592 domain-containing protein [Candidatus Woesebacteria bacterium]|nr:DUF3592 domain-containing protein [Candidatus Woesebacteria bacterium]
MKQRTRNQSLFEAAFAFIVVGFFGSLFVKQGLTAYSFGKNIEKNAVATTGTVIAFKESSDTDGGKHYRPIVQFQDSSGQTHTFKNKFETRDFAKAYVGSSISVLYLPDDPTTATTNPPSFILWNSVFYLVTGATFIIIGAVGANKVYHRV